MASRTSAAPRAEAATGWEIAPRPCERPSTGFLAVVLALQICRKVSLFGLSSDPCRPFHYYGPAKPSCTPEIPKENDERVHWFEKEHELYDVWSRQGKLTQYS